MKSRRFVDSAVLYTRAGKGGDGSASFRREKFIANGGPDGGDGGRGGHIILRGDRDTDSLIAIYFAPHRKARSGGSGRGKQLHGKNGGDLVVPVPCGTEVHNSETGELLCDITEHDAEFMAARGGKGGLGNVHWKTSTHQAPREFTPGEPGEEIAYRLELKLSADIGLVGYPNAGKSSLLTCLSDAHPKIGAYPFTTLNPIIGTIIFDDYSRLKLADIPGIIDGAHDGIGLGHAFLRHVERARYLMFVIDMSGVDGRKPYEDYASLRREITLHRKELAERPSLVVANKMDSPEYEENLREFVAETGAEPLQVSALTGDGVDTLKQALFELCRPQA